MKFTEQDVKKIAMGATSGLIAALIFSWMQNRKAAKRAR